MTNRDFRWVLLVVAADRLKQLVRAEELRRDLRHAELLRGCGFHLPLPRRAAYGVRVSFRSGDDGAIVRWFCDLQQLLASHSLTSSSCGVVWSSSTGVRRRGGLLPWLPLRVFDLLARRVLRRARPRPRRCETAGAHSDVSTATGVGMAAASPRAAVGV